MFTTSSKFSVAIKAPARTTTAITTILVNKNAKPLSASITDSEITNNAPSLFRGFLKNTMYTYSGQSCPTYITEAYSPSISTQVSDSSGVFITPVIFTVNYENAHLCNNVLIVCNEHDMIKEARIVMYDNDAPVYDTVITVDKPRIGIQGMGVVCNKIELIVMSTHLPNRPATIFFMGSPYRLIFEKTDFSDISVLEALGADDILPYSNVSANELSYSLDNIDSLFTPSNKESAMYGLMTPGSFTEVFIGVEVEIDKFEMIPMGEYYVTEWSAPNGSPYSSITAHDILYDLLDKELPLLRTVYNETISSLFRRVMEALKVPVNKYKIEVTKTVPITFGFQIGSKVSDTFNAICEAGVCYITCNRNGEIVLKDFEYNKPVLTMSADDYIFDINNLERFDSIINALNITVYEPTLWRVNDSLKDFVGKVSPGTFVLDDITLTDSPVVLVNSVGLTDSPGCTIKDIDYGHNKLRLTIQNSTSQSATVNVTASVVHIKFIERSTTTPASPQSRTNMVINNQLIQTTEHANMIVGALSDTIKDPFSLFTWSSRGNPAAEPGDLILLKAPIAKVFDEVIELRSAKYTFDGGLECDYTGRRVKYD